MVKKSSIRCREDVKGNKFWYKRGKLHREDGPAIEFANGHKAWYRNGTLREDGPAREYANGNKCWIYQDVLYRINDHEINNYICKNCGMLCNNNYAAYFFSDNSWFYVNFHVMRSCAEENMLRALI